MKKRKKSAFFYVTPKKKVAVSITRPFFLKRWKKLLSLRKQKRMLGNKENVFVFFFVKAGKYLRVMT